MGKVKGQKKKANGEYAPVMPYWFRGMETLGEESTAMVLQQVLDGEFTWKEFQIECGVQGKLHRIQGGFITCLGVATWEEVRQTIPNNSRRDDLEKLLEVSIL